MTEEERRGMLAWYASGRLSDAERADVERSLADTRAEDLRRELDEFRALRAAVAEVGPEEPVFPPNLIQEAWRRIQVHEREQAARAEARPAARLARLLDTHVLSLWRNATGVGRLALAGQLGLVLLLSAALLRPPADDGEYRTSSGPVVGGPSPSPAVPPEPAQPQLQVKVMFTETATQQDVGALLRRLDAEIVGGPSALGLYTVAVQGPADPEGRARALEALVSALEAESALVRGVAREGP